MKVSLFSRAAVMFVCLTTLVTAAEAPPTDVVVVDHAKVDAAFAKGMPMLVNSSYKIQAGRRVTGGNVEVHANDTDIFYVTEGEATFVTGGTPVDPKTTGPGEVRAEKITGGTTRKLVKGDVIVVPAGVPHWFTEVKGTFLYFVVKVTK
jgi:quercetin dioxygenase-like cupin family protein